jgi:hypothetical protein
MIKEFWTADSPLQSTIILLVEAIAVALQSEFKEGGGERIYLVLVWVWPRLLFRSRTDCACPQKPNPSREAVPLS